MIERKRFSARRDERLYRIVHDRVVECRIATLKGALAGLSVVGQERAITEMLDDLAGIVSAEYRKSYAKDKS
jgi:uncharacterized protein with von Willebrand factor type A (vWA) domain